MPLDIPDRDDWFDNRDGLSRPNWGAVNGWMRVFVPEAELGDAWVQFTRHWLARLRDGLGGNYALTESENFHYLSEHASDEAARSLAFFERARRHIYKVLGSIGPPNIPGKHLVFRFTETDDYYAYVAHFYPEGVSAGSSGMFIADGYYHIAHADGFSPDEDRRIVAHELTHNLLVYLPLPRWLNEALAMAFEADIGGGVHESLSRDLAARHREYWDATTIQAFWLGTSFLDVDGQELAYSLSRILLNLIQTELRPLEREFRRFVLRADWSDAGAIAAREHLDVDLENLVATFLGPGDWAPLPKTWQREGKAEENV